MDQVDSQQLMRVLDSLERKLGQLRQQYEQYFLGIEKREPAALRKEVDGMFRQYGSTTVQNTGLKFRLGGLTARYNSFRAYWDKQLRDLEEGHSKRDIFRARLQDRERENESSSSEPQSSNRKPSSASEPISSGVKQIYQQYIAARKKTNETKGEMSPERLQQILTEQSKLIRERYNCKRVTFKVVVENGKTKIKAQPKNDS